MLEMVARIPRVFDLMTDCLWAGMKELVAGPKVEGKIECGEEMTRYNRNVISIMDDKICY
jgi:hypothetical protein